MVGGCAQVCRSLLSARTTRCPPRGVTRALAKHAMLREQREPASGQRRSSDAQCQDSEEDSQASSPQAQTLGAIAPPPGLEGGPILADFLAMGGSVGSVGAAGSSAIPAAVVPPPVHVAPVAALATSPEQLARATGPVFQERQLVVAALGRRQAVEQRLSEAPSKVPMSRVPRRAPEFVPRLFVDSFASYARRSHSAEEAEPSTSTVPIARPAASRRKLRVLRWHRGALQKIMCQEMLAHFLQDTRAALRIPRDDNVLYKWELDAANEHADAGALADLVRYLVETECHIHFGFERSTKFPGRKTLPEDKRGASLRAERKRLVRDMDSLGSWKAWNSLTLKEDDAMRAFLDGRASWLLVRNLLLGQNSVIPPSREGTDGNPVFVGY